MNNLFKKGFASLALASMMMTSGVYAVGSDAMIDVKKFETDGLSKTMVLAGTDGNGTNTTAFIKSIKGLEVVVNVRTASKNMMPLFDSDFQASSNSIKNSFMPFKDDDRDNMLRSNFGSMSAILAIPKVDSMSLVFAGAKVIGGDMKFGDNRLNTSLAFQRTDLTIGDNMKPGHNMLNIPLAFIDVKSLGGQTGTLNLKQRINMNNDNMIAFKRTDLTKSGIHNPVIKHLSLANVGFSPSIIPLSKHTGDNLAFFVLNEGSILTPSLGENNMNNTGLISNYVLGNNTAGISCASPVNKVNSNPHSSNCIRNDLTVTNIILNPTGDSGAQLAIGNSGANFAILEAV